MAIVFRPLNGAKDDEKTQARAYILEVDGCRILLDVGVEPFSFTEESCSTIDAFLKDSNNNHLDAILLSHGDLAHIGGLPVVYNHFKDTQKQMPVVFATTPVMHLGRQALLDARLSYKQQNGTAFPIRLAFLHSTMDCVKPLKYSQPITLPTRPDITVMAMPAGHSLGGAMWRIRSTGAASASSPEDIVYAVDFDHKKGVCLDGAAFDLLSRPTCMIVDCKQALAVSDQARKERDAAFLGSLKSLMNQQNKPNTVLIPIESACRHLEFMFMLDKWFGEQQTGKLFFMTMYQPAKTVDFYKGMLEWMSPQMMKMFDVKRENPFDLKNTCFVDNVDDIFKQTLPKVILASDEFLNSGASWQCLSHYAGSHHLHVLLIENPSPNSLAYKLLNSTNNKLEIEFSTSEALRGIELIKYRKERQAMKEAQQAEAAFARMKKSEFALDSDSDDEDIEGANERSREEEIKSAQALMQVFWSDYRHDLWVNDTANDDPLGLPKTKPIGFVVAKNKRTRRRANDSDYGQLVPVDAFDREASSNVQTANLTNTEEFDLAAQARILINKRKEEEEQEELESGDPVKWVKQTKELVLKCQRKFISGYNYLSDGRSLRNIIRQVSPRRLVLIGGGKEATEYLYNHFLYSCPEIGLNEVVAPSCGETIELQSAASSVPVSLTESLMETLKIINMPNNSQLSHLLGRLSLDSDSGLIKLENCDSLVKHPMNPVLIGDLKAGELKKTFQLHGLHAEFGRGGDLVITDDNGDQVLLKRMGDSEWTLEGEQSDTFDRTREIFYSAVACI